MSHRVLGVLLLLLVAFGLVGPAGAASAVTVASAPGPTTVGDDFEGPAGPVDDMWLVGAGFGSGPVVETGQVTQGDPSNFWENLVWSAPLDSDALWLEVDVVDAALPVMLVLHHDGDASTPAENNGYGLRWQPVEQRVTVLKNGEYRGPQATSGGPYAGPHTLRAEWDGNHIRFLVDGELVMEWSDELGPALGGADRRRVGVMFPPIGSAVHIEAVRGGTLDASVAPTTTSETTTSETAAPTATSETAAPTTTSATAALPSSTAPMPVPPATDAVSDNSFIPDRGLDDCVSALPEPDCGSEARSEWRQWAILGVLVVAIGFIGWRIVRSKRRSRPDPSANHEA